MGFITKILPALLLLLPACSHSEPQKGGAGPNASISEDQGIDGEPLRQSGSLILRKRDPKANQILQESCPGGYDPIDDFSNPPSTEIGISKDISGGNFGPYVRYRCRGI